MFLAAIGYLVSTACSAVLTLLLIRIVFGWFSKNEDHPVYRITHLVTEPLIGPIQSRLSTRATAGIDLSPAIVAFALMVVIAITRTMY